MKRLVLIAALILPASACAPAMQPSNGLIADAKPIIEVHNGSAANVDVYAVRGFTSVRLGMVPAQRTAQLQLPSAYFGISGFSIVARAFAVDQSYRSEGISLEAGQRLMVQLLDPLPSASVALLSRR